VNPPLGFLEIDHIWLDDRRSGRWALRGVSLALEPGTTAALVDDEIAAHAVLDVLTGRRCPVRGRVAIDGVDLRDLDDDQLRQGVTELVAVDGGERRVQVGRTAVVAAPRACTQANADLVVVLGDGLEHDRVVSLAA
jgi:ABC-type transport system involved in Fe-S cluster assembly fused permease/ATPase subunit